MAITPNLEEVQIVPVRSPSGLPRLAQAIAQATRVAVDTETHSGAVFDNGLWAALRVVSVAVRFPDGHLEAYVVDVRDVPTAELAPVLGQIEVADAWNANFDDRVLDLAGCNVQSWRDAMHVDSVLHSGMTGFDFWHGLAFASKKYLGLELSGKGTTQTSYDAESDLTEEQIRYPGYDALITLLVAERLDELVVENGLQTPAMLEASARPFILEMTKRGIPFQLGRWQDEVLGVHRDGKADAMSELADLTGGSEVTLFGETEGPSWNPDSDTDVRAALNKWAPAAVKAFTGGRLLERSDKLDKTTLKQIGHPVAKALLRYREHAKILSTYGANLDQFVGEDGRMRPQYKQGGVVATGRLSSDSPNAQNFSPKMKPYFRPDPQVMPSGEVRDRVFVHADLSQAELRVLAQVSEEDRMRELFRLGGDFHARTAADMFQVDMDSLRTEDPAAYGNHRKKAKGVNFGIPYGLGAAALATDLTVNSGLATTTEEAQEALARYAKAYPAVDAWLGARDRYVKSLASDPGQVDWVASLALFEVHSVAAPARKSLRRKLKRPPSDVEISFEVFPDSTLRTEITAELGREPSDGEIEKRRVEHASSVTWALKFDAPVVLRPDGTPWAFESRSLSGRRRMFTIPMQSSSTAKGKFEGVITSAVLQVCTSDKPVVAALREEFAQQYGLSLPVGVDRCGRVSGETQKEFRARSSAFRKAERVKLIKEFEGDRKKLKYELIRFVASRMGDDVVRGYLLPMALDDQIRALGNRFRNHPIQSLVADVGLAYYSDLWLRLAKYRNAFPVQAVHDSIVIECDLDEAVVLCAEVKAALEGALASWCPDVPAVADADIRLSLSDSDVVEPEDIPALVVTLAGKRGQVPVHA